MVTSGWRYRRSEHHWLSPCRSAAPPQIIKPLHVPTLWLMLSLVACADCVQITALLFANVSGMWCSVDRQLVFQQSCFTYSHPAPPSLPHTSCLEARLILPSLPEEFSLARTQSWVISALQLELKYYREDKTYFKLYFSI